MEFLNYSKVSMNKINRSKYVAVFLKNKLISLNSILPLALEMNQCCGYKFYFIVWEYESYRSIVEDNIVLRDMALSVGEIVCPDSASNTNIISRKINKIILLTKILFKFSFKKYYIFHFGVFDIKPFILITKLIDKNKIVRCESSIVGRYAKDMYHLLHGRNVSARNLLQLRSTREILDMYIKDEYLVNNSGVLVGFNQDWNWFKHTDARYCKKLIFNEGLNAKSFSNFIEKNSDYYLSQESLLDLDKNKTIVVVLGHYGDGSPEVQSMRNKLLYEILVVLRKLEMNAIIKPHIYCDMGLVKSIVKDAKCKESRIFYTKIYPNVLQKVSIGGLFVNKSTLRCHYQDIGFPVIQYNGGMFDRMTPDHCSGIVCSNQNQLTKHLKELMKKANSNDSIMEKNKESVESCDKIKKVFCCIES